MMTYKIKIRPKALKFIEKQDKFKDYELVVKIIIG